jgi:hypothetical protein
VIIIVNRRAKLILMIVLISVTLLANACKTSENYDDKERQFNKLYLEIVDNIDYNDTQGSIRILQTNENKVKIGKLEILLDSMEDYLVKEKKQVYDVYLEQYVGLKFLSELKKEWRDMSIDERSKATTEIGLIELSKMNKTNK